MILKKKIIFIIIGLLQLRLRRYSPIVYKKKYIYIYIYSVYK